MFKDYEGQTTMKLFDYGSYEDYGWEFFFQLFIFSKVTLIDLTIQWDDYGVDDIFPEFAMSIGAHRLGGFSFRWKRFEIQCDILDSRPRNLEWYRENYDGRHSII